MNQKKLEIHQSRIYGTDEIDLFELFAMLWREKIIIIATTLVFATAAFFYNPPGTIQYNTIMTVKPAPLNLYGKFIAGIENNEKQSITLARYTAEQILVLFKSHLSESQAQYFKGKDIVGFRVDAKGEHEVTLQLSTLQDDDAVATLQGYLAMVSEITKKEVNEFLFEVGLPGTITSEMLFSSDEPITTKINLAKSKKDLVLATSIVLGGAVGVFIALIRGAIRSRKKNGK